ncbi:Na+/H+ antiporter NhaD/arsenite permease-like protein [Desulfobotulus alkaliphilus]|uniref:Na+/H+ antiporter NhaD/arsenite permease-like protein n=1 Tax=Desulfobotulus alkaliphilus TaxID=622671 RepID=A0A562RV63_9BACT|nr:SLC13 family permease [Desulfobotulus alkaliphilus]TWI72280.1 Na+/H+ antiporter NhaD/arsenite permease-like protein [Desulfobotulus alkaliphilus]
MAVTLHVILRSIRDNWLLVLLTAVLLLLLWGRPEKTLELDRFVHWPTLAALAGLMILSRGLEDSGMLARAGHLLLGWVYGQRRLACVLVLFSALLSAIVTNDVALFIVVPLTLALRTVTPLPIGRMVIFEAFAVNAGSAISPVGNPQNLFLWQASEAGFMDFLFAMMPLSAMLLLLVLLLIPLAFPAMPIESADLGDSRPVKLPMALVSLFFYPVFLFMLEQGWALAALGLIAVVYLVFWRGVLCGVDWLLLMVFVLMFMVTGLLAALPWMHGAAGLGAKLPGGIFTSAMLLSQGISNVPATLFLHHFTHDWQLLAWGASVGGFGLATGSMANLIALRLARNYRLWWSFHLWSLPLLVMGWLAGMIL